MITFKLQIAERNNSRYNNDKKGFRNMRRFVFRMVDMDGFWNSQLADLFDDVREMNDGESICFFTSKQHVFKANNVQEAEQKFNHWWQLSKNEGWDGFTPKLHDAFMIKKTAKSYLLKNIDIH